MPELTHDVEDGFHEIQLSGKQLVFLFMATTVLSVVIFLCGVLVGRGVRAEKGGEEATVAAAPAPSTPVQQSAPVAAEPPSPATEVPITYPERLGRGDAQKEEAKAPKEEPRKEEVKKAAEPAPTEPPPVPPAAAAKPAPPPLPAVNGGAEAPTTGRPGSWVIQVHALQNRDAANKFVQTLNSKGYPAFLLPPAAGSPQIYRVQIGGYPDRGEAEKIASRLEKEEQLNPAIKRR